MASTFFKFSSTELSDIYIPVANIACVQDTGSEVKLILHKGIHSRTGEGQVAGGDMLTMRAETADAFRAWLKQHVDE